MKMIIALLSAASFLAASAFAQDATQKVEEPTKKTLTAEDIAGKTFVYLDGAWGNRSMYLRKDGTFRLCGGPNTGCDDGTWSLDGDKLVRVHKTWFAQVNHRPKPVQLTLNGKEGTFAGLKARVLDPEDKFPLSVIYDDPRK